jgi:glycosyltransferase involved in cell wall biosynthesis
LLADKPNLNKYEIYVFCKKSDIKEYEQYNVKLIGFDNDLEGDLLIKRMNYEIDINQINILFCPLSILEPLDCDVLKAIYIPDMQYEYFPSKYSEELLQLKATLLPGSVQDADLIITTSNEAKNSIIKYLHAQENIVTTEPTWDALSTLYSKRSSKIKNFDYSDIKKWPKISVIIPSYQYGRFIKRAIDSVLEQNYENVEVIVMDGGSKDNTVEILKNYGDKITWFSEKDKGQTDAINKGLKIATGDIIAYLNSDDTYIKGALHFAGAYFVRNANSLFLQGKGIYIDADDNYIIDYVNKPASLQSLHGECSLCQPACFWRKTLSDEMGLFDTEFDYAMDYEYWIRIASKGYSLDFVSIYLGNSRDHDETKTNSQRQKIFNNIFKLNKKYYGKVHTNWIIGYTINSLPYREDRSTIDKLFYHLKVIISCEINNLKINHRILTKDLRTYYKKSIISFYRQFASTTSHKGLLDFVRRNFHRVKDVVTFITRSEPLIHKFMRLIQNTFKLVYKDYLQIGILEQYDPREIKLDRFPTINKNQKKLSFAIVTPSYNHAEFIERTVNSVLDQNYPSLEYIVQDGGSKDNTVEILKKYGNKIKFESVKDKGQADAINIGFKKISGEIMAFVNSDDVLLANSLAYVNDYFIKHPEVDVLYGNRIIINNDDKEIGKWVLPPFDYETIKNIDFIPQETLFWRKSIWDKLEFGMDDSFKFALDWDLITRFINVGARIEHVPYFLGAFRYTKEQKTSSQMDNYGWNEFQRVGLHIHKRLINPNEIPEHIIKYRERSSMYAWWLSKGIR